MGWNPSGDPDVPWPELVLDENQRATLRCAELYYPYRGTGNGNDSCPRGLRDRIVSMMNSRVQTEGRTPSTRNVESSASRIAAVNAVLRTGGQQLRVDQISIHWGKSGALWRPSLTPRMRPRLMWR